MPISNFYCPINGNLSCVNGNYGTTSWSTCRGSSTGSSVNADSGTGQTSQCRSTGGAYINMRWHVPIDLTSLPASTKINSAVLYFYVGAKVGTSSGSLHLVPSTMTDPTNCVANDYPNVTFSSLGNVSTVSFSNWNTITLNVANVTPGQYNKYALIYTDDLTNTAPGSEEWVTSIVTSGYANKPYLLLNYTLPSAGNPLFFTNFSVG